MQATNEPDWEALEAALDALLDANPEERHRILADLDAGDAAVAQRARVLLQLALDDTVFPDSLDDAAPELFSELANEDVQTHLGETLGPYRIVEVIRRGGMGVVFRGERDDGTYEQSVAIKLIPAPIASEGARALFDHERRHLARLEHPNIARIIDAGVTSADTPYYIMEYIDGVSIDDFLRGCTRRRVLDCFLELCDALVYCHKSMIVHGDIKPANVLVADGRVRLLDFGIGQLLDESQQREGDQAVRAFSPGFAAPEQLRGEGVSISSDVYSLGVVLKRLLSAAQAKTLPRDLDAILTRCLADDPAVRYESVGALRDDICNHLGNIPVTARQPTTFYRTGRFVRRNKLLVGATAGVVLALGVGLAVALWQYDVARTQAVRAEQVKGFLTSLFEQADPVVAGEREVTLREVVDEAAGRLDTELTDVPDVRAEVTQLIGNAYFGIGEYDDAFELHAQSLEHWRATHRVPHLDTVKALNKLGADHTQRGEYTEAIQLHREALAQLEALGLSESSDAWGSWTHLGNALRQIDPPQGTEAMLQAHTINLAIRPDDPAALARSLGNVASGYRAERKIVESANYHEQALAVADANNERLAPDILSIRCNLALDYGTLGHHAQARASQQTCNAMTVERFGADHPANVSNLNNLGALDLRMGLLDEAEHTYGQALLIAEAKLPALALDRLATEINYAVVQWHSGRIARAERELQGLLVRMEQSFGAAHPASGRVRSLLGRVLLERGDAEAASHLIENSLDGLTPYWRCDALLWLAEAHNALGETNSAATYARESLELRQSIPHYTRWQVAEAEHALATATNDTALLAQSEQHFADDLPPGHFRRNP